MVMMRKSAWRKNNLREIKHTLERYLAIVAIIALGVGFFSGLRITRTAMVKSLDTYASKQQMYDFRLLSTLGLTKEDVEYFKEQEKLIAEGAISMDFIADMGAGKELVLRAHSMTQEMNLLNIKYGRIAEAGNECVLDARFFPKEILGSTIRIASNNEEETMDAFAYEEYTVVGLADSVYYLSYDRGTTSLGSGSISGFVYMPEGGFSTDYYTEIIVRLESYHEVYSKEYKDLITAKERPLKEALELRGELRYESIVEEARQKIADAQKEYDEGYQEYLDERTKAEDELNQALQDLTDAKKEIDQQEAKLKDGEEKLADGEREYEKSFKDYTVAYEKFKDKKESTFTELDAQQEELDRNRSDVTTGMKQIEESGVLDQYQELTENRKNLEAALTLIGDPNSEEYFTTFGQLQQIRAAIQQIEMTGVIQQYEELKGNLSQIDEGQEQLTQGRAKASKEFAAAEAQLTEAKGQLAEAKEEIDKNKEEIRKGWKVLEEGKEKYEEGLQEYEDGKEEAESSFAEAEEELKNAQEEIDKALKEIEDIPKAKVYVLSRNQNVGYASFENDSSIVDGIAKILPIFFFLVAALVCLTTMARMVDEQRTQIGTLKALGYSDRAIAGKYMFYSGSAAILGCAIGYLLGTKFFPMAIWEAYGMLYGFSNIEYVFDISLAIISLTVSLFCSAGVTFISSKAELLQMPAQLIRPKAPKAGRRVLLERIPFLWKRISFLHKVSIRNILRYKRRFFMTILGIAGCTSLVVAALGISNSIRNLGNNQFDTIMTYDYNISFTEEQSMEEREKFAEKFSDLLSECVFVSTQEMEVVQKGKIKKATIVATDDPEITRLIGLYYKEEIMPYPPTGKVAVNKKLAEELGLKPGDTITIKRNETDTAEVEISITFENYMNNYLFMTAETYRALFGEELLYKNAYASTNQEDIYQVSAALSKGDQVATVSVMNDLRSMIDNMMTSLDSIIWLVIACAGALGFVVIYNLNNINITERNREIATIKVIGFYANETRSYVFRETLILTLIGSLLGLGLGKLLHMFIMDQIKVDAVSFKEQIFGISYLISILVTFAITLLVNLLLNKKIDRINMTESLKSVE